MWDQGGLDTFAKACKLPAKNFTVDHQIGPERPFKCKIPLLGTELCMEAMRKRAPTRTRRSTSVPALRPPPARLR